jgi:fibronectin-binding autotransporter adhesin
MFPLSAMLLGKLRLSAGARGGERLSNSSLVSCENGRARRIAFNVATAVSLALGLMTARASPQTIVGWIGQDGSNWSNSQNWLGASGYTLPATGNDVVLYLELNPAQSPPFNPPTTYDLNSTNHAVTLRSITFQTWPNAFAQPTYTISPATSADVITLQGGPGSGITNNDNSTATNGTTSPVPISIEVATGIVLDGSVTFVEGQGSGRMVFLGPITGTGGLTLDNGSGPQYGSRLEVWGQNTYTGPTIVTGAANAGVLFEVGAGGNPVPASSALTVDSGNYAEFTGSTTIGSLAGGGTVYMNGTLTAGGDNANTTFSGIYEDFGSNPGTAALNKAGYGTMSLTGANTYTGGTTVSYGTLQLGNGGTTGSILGNVDLADATSGLSFNRSDVVTFNGVISGLGSVYQVGSGTTILTGVNTFTHGSVINGGTLAVAADDNLGYAGPTGGITFNGGTLQFLGSFTTGRTMTLNSFAGPGGTFDTNGNDATLSGLITGYGPLAKIGAGILTLSGTSNYSGLTDVNAGTLQAGSTGGLSSASAFTVALGATLDLNGFNETVGSLAGAGDVVSTSGSAASGQTLTAGANNTSTSFSGTISDGAGPTGFIKVGTGTLTLLGDNAYTGGTTISAGTLQLGDGGTAGSITGDVMDNGTLAFNRSDAAGLYSGVISGSGAVQQLGTGATTLTGANTYTGGTTISAGTLQLGNGGTTGSVTGDVTDNGALAFNRSDAAALYSGVVSGSGTVQQLGTGTTTLTGANTYTGGTTLSAGTLAVSADTNLGSAAGGVTFNGGTLRLLGPSFASSRSMTLNAGGGTLDTNGNDALLSGTIVGTGSFTKAGAGLLTLSGADTYTGVSDVQAGALMVNGSLASLGVTVENAATLGGTGAITNAVTIVKGGTLAPGSGTTPGTLTVGSLTLNSGSTLAYVLGTANVIGGSTNDVTNVTGDLTLAGTLNVTNSSSFELGAYRLLNYGGKLTGGTLGLGTLPGSFSGLIQTAISGQVNLIVNGPGALVQLWDGATSSGDSTVHGGLGAWDASSTNWTAPNGAINASWQSGFGIFSGTGGTVTVSVPLAYQGLQFSSNGYELSGSGSLTPVGQAPIRVDAGVTSNISTQITGSGGVIKSDPGVLVLSGSNSYTGGTTVTSGTLSLTNASAIGSGTLGLNPGTTLDLNGSFNLPVAATLSGDALVNVAQGNASTLSGVVSNAVQPNSPGILEKTGLGTLLLSGANSYSGGTLVDAGTVEVSSNRALGSGTVGISSGATLQSGVGNLSLGNAITLGSVTTIDTQSYALTLSGAITDGGTAGGLNKIGIGTLTLIGTDTYSGGTTISAGTVQVGNGGTTGHIGGNVTDNGTLAFNRSDAAATFSGAISGSGAVQQLGTGTTTLTGANTYTGGTTIATGTLQLGGGGTTGSITGNVTDNGALAFDRSDSVTFGGVISGRGAVEQKGSGKTTLTGTDPYTGATTVSAGTLVVNGSLASAVTVNEGATLAGLGSIGGATLDTGATLSPGDSLGAFATANGAFDVQRSAIRGATLNIDGTPSPSSAIGTLTINGALAFQPGANYVVHVSPGGQSDITDVNGKATLTGGTVLALASGSNYRPFTTYTILTASGGVTGTFAGVTTNLAFLTPTLGYDANDVLLRLTRNDVSFASVALTSNESAVGNAVQVASQGALSASGSKLIYAIESLDAPGARAAFEALSGEGVVATENLTFASGDLFLSSLHEQGELWRSEAATDSRGGSQESQASGLHTWGTVLGSSLDFKGSADAGLAEQSDQLWGIAAGFDGQLTPNLLIGAALGGSEGDLSVLQRLTSGSVRGFHVGTYGVLNVTPSFYTSAEVAYSSYHNSTKRMLQPLGGLSGETESGSFGGDELRGRIELGRQFGFGDAGLDTWSVTPYAAIEGAQLWTGRFTEATGGASAPGILSLSFARHTSSSAPSFLGLKFEDHQPLGNGLLFEPSLNVAWVHEFSDRRDMSAMLNSLPGSLFMVDGARPSRGGLEVRADTELALSRDAVLYANLQGDFSGQQRNYAVQAGIRVSW